MGRREVVEVAGGSLAFIFCYLCHEVSVRVCARVRVLMNVKDILWSQLTFSAEIV